MAAQPYGYGDLTYAGAVRIVARTWVVWALRFTLLVVDGTINGIEARVRGR